MILTMSIPETGHYILETIDSRDIEEGVTVDLNEKGHIVGIEILDASDKLELSELVNISIENLPLEKLASSR